MKKKLFISCPMRGRTAEAIQLSMDRMYKIAEAVTGEELEVIPSYFTEKAPTGTREAVFMLGKSIQKLAEADYFVGFWFMDGYPGCKIERDVARTHKIPFIDLDDSWAKYIAPDIDLSIHDDKTSC